MSKWLIRSVQGRVLLTLLLLSIAPLAIATLQGYHCARQAVDDLTQKHLVSVVRAREALVREWYTERAKDIRAIEVLPGFADEATKVVSGTTDNSNKLLQDLLSKARLEESGFESMSFYTNDWRLLARADFDEHADEELMTDRLMADLKVSDKIILEDVHMHHDSDIGAHIGHVIRDGGGARIGYLVGNLNLSKSLTPLLQERSGLWNTGKAYLATSDLRIFSEPFVKGERVSFQRNASATVRECLSSETPRILEYADYRGHEVLGTAVRLPINDWLLVAEIDRSEALIWLDKLIYRATLTVLATLVAILASSVWLSFFLGRPLRQLVTIANRVRGGHTNERVPPTHIIEADKVGMAFNEMLDELRIQQDSVARTTALASIGEITSSIVHEMRNPLSSVKMNLQALSRSLAPGDINTEAAEIAASHLARIENMLTDLLQLGRPVSVNLDKTSFEELVEMSLSVAADLNHEKDIRYEVKRRLDDGILVVDKEQMCRALSNLVINAVQASPPHSLIQITLEQSPHGDRFWDIVVRDSGTGLTEMAAKKVFQPFFTTKPGGIGLGLANVKKIVELHGGFVAARNGDAGGTVFRITLPRVPRLASLRAN